MRDSKVRFPRTGVIVPLPGAHLPIGRSVFGDYRLTSRLTVDTAVAANIPSIWDLPDDRPRLALDIEPQAKYGALLLQVPPNRRIQIERAEVV